MKKQAVKHTSKLDKLTAAVMQDATHAATVDIVRQRGVLFAVGDAIEQEIIEVSARLADARARRARNEATLMGLGLVVAKR